MLSLQVFKTFGFEPSGGRIPAVIRENPSSLRMYVAIREYAKRLSAFLYLPFRQLCRSGGDGKILELFNKKLMLYVTASQCGAYDDAMRHGVELLDISVIAGIERSYIEARFNPFQSAFFRVSEGIHNLHSILLQHNPDYSRPIGVESIPFAAPTARERTTIMSPNTTSQGLGSKVVHTGSEAASTTTAATAVIEARMMGVPPAAPLDSSHGGQFTGLLPDELEHSQKVFEMQKCKVSLIIPVLSLLIEHLYLYTLACVLLYALACARARARVCVFDRSAFGSRELYTTMII